MTTWLVACLAFVVAGLSGEASHATIGHGAGPGSSRVGPVAALQPGVVSPPVPGSLGELGAVGRAGARRAAPPDRWIAEDKVRHFVVSFAATGMTYGAARVAAGAGEARIGAVAAAAVLGLGKELVDVRRGGAFSLKDLAWDAAGVVLGYTLLERME